MTGAGRMLKKAEGKYVTTELQGELVLMNVDTGAFYALKDTALDIWNLLDTVEDRDALIEALLARYKVSPEQAQREVDRLLAELKGAGLLVE